MQTVNTQYAAARTIPNEHNDCAVIATSVAVNKPYAAVHAVYASAGRKCRRGTSIATIDTSLAILAAGTGAARPEPSRQHKRTLAQWLADHRTGRYVVAVTGHAIAVVDGVVHDWGKATSGPRKQVYCSWDVSQIAVGESKARRAAPKAFEINWPKLGKRPAVECPTLDD